METGFNIGILGGGFVGSAVGFGFSSSNNYNFNIKIHDTDPDKSTHSFKDMSASSDFIFVCLPTPHNEDMSIDLSYIEEGVQSLSDVINPFKQTIIIKSTVVPGTCRRLSKKYGMNIVSNPEFLTERRSKWDFINATQIIIGSDESESASRVKSLYNKRFSSMRYLVTDSVTSEFIKYMLNCFFSVKVSLMNEFHQIAESSGVNWDDAIKGFVGDSRVGDSHISVPGPDGKMGFGGHCFPKDINALICFAERIGVDPKIIKSAWDKNLEVRND